MYTIYDIYVNQLITDKIDKLCSIFVQNSFEKCIDLSQVSTIYTNQIKNIF